MLIARLVKVAVTIPNTAIPGVVYCAIEIPPIESMVAPELSRLINTRKKRGNASVKKAAIGVLKKILV